ncbi:hypothetical protein TREMEDRAFT_56065 [Tremella mesenterica DSM 1558]|uniref:uncharacterized protein n=1 Tax=Tremella mesenterica (strain ATCC 24925 / CBS 8224 / DSM 1558 / NBRC 9311 / NRRL Y-6157 / RJB 2259-6 / UBC 559-6) TaxID=578456 RepID=UPI0003F49476|nr:uncharacterized protein TREMEDRAFT_56065 [Tremella mesenterica DSM 1558]EIW72886.1 hypothetical protein TREMEDRAFT_56065 [Tremella mesenterica DSM 1558]
MFGLFSSSSSSPPPTTSTNPPNKAERQACWDSRDAYFACLTDNGVRLAGEEGKGVCEKEKEVYSRNCGKSWIDYFNKRRALELRQKATFDAASKQRDENPANVGR